MGSCDAAEETPGQKVAAECRSNEPYYGSRSVRSLVHYAQAHRNPTKRPKRTPLAQPDRPDPRAQRPRARQKQHEDPRSAHRGSSINVAWGWRPHSGRQRLSSRLCTYRPCPCAPRLVCPCSRRHFRVPRSRSACPASACRPPSRTPALTARCRGRPPLRRRPRR